MSEVSDVLRDRMLEPGGFERMATLSVLAHGAALALVLLAPGSLWPHRSDQVRPTMMITLGDGASGPNSGGMTQLGGRPVQAVKPPDAPPVREPVRPPAAKAPEMVLPDPKSKPSKAAPAPVVKEAPEGARGRTPTRGERTRPGSTVADTGVRGQGFGLSTVSGSGSGSYLDVSNFCCPEYIEIMVDRIRGNWNSRAENVGEAIVKFTIYHDGSIRDVMLERSSQYSALDLSAQRAVLMTRTLPPLPAAFTNPTLTVHLNFQYQR
jgi:TonB family protein